MSPATPGSANGLCGLGRRLGVEHAIAERASERRRARTSPPRATPTAASVARARWPSGNSSGIATPTRPIQTSDTQSSSHIATVTGSSAVDV